MKRRLSRFLENPRTARALLLSGAILSLSFVETQAETWTPINNAEDVRKIISGNALDGKYWSFYFRSDGRMAYEQGGFISIREWSVREDGAICMNIFSMPEKILGCEVLFRTKETPEKFRLSGQTGQTMVDIIAPKQELVDAVAEKAGALE